MARSDRTGKRKSREIFIAETFKQRTGQEYHKDNPQIYAVLNRFGDESKAIQIAENRFQGYLKNDINKPSKMCPCTTIQK